MSRGAPDGRRLARWGAWVAAALAAACTDASSPLNVVPLEPERIEPAAATADVRGPVGAAVDEDPAVLVRDRFGNPVPGVEVRFEVTEGGGTVVTPVDTTGADGRASTSWRLGTRVGPNTMRALVGADTITFAATGEPSFPSRITPLAGAGQADTVTHTLRDTLVVEVVDLYGNLTQK